MGGLFFKVGTGYQLAGVVPKILGSTDTGAILWVWVPKLSSSIWYLYLSYSFFSSYESIFRTKSFLLQLVLNFDVNSIHILYLLCICILITLLNEIARKTYAHKSEKTKRNSMQKYCCHWAILTRANKLMFILIMFILIMFILINKNEKAYIYRNARL